MDVSSSIGTGVASLVVDPKEVRYVLLDTKRFYYGAPAPEVMRPILALPFNPQWIHNILFEEAFTEPGLVVSAGRGRLAERLRARLERHQDQLDRAQGSDQIHHHRTPAGERADQRAIVQAGGRRA